MTEEVNGNFTTPEILSWFPNFPRRLAVPPWSPLMLPHSRLYLLGWSLCAQKPKSVPCENL